MATTQVQTRLSGSLLTALAAVLAIGLAGADARAGGNWMPLLPDQDFYDFQLFAPPDLQEYGVYQEAPEGLFFTYDRLYWAITPPSVRGVGRTQLGGYIIPSAPISPQTIVQLNNGSLQASAQNPQLPANVIGGVFLFGADPLQLDLNTSWMRTAMSWGNRYEGGWIYDDLGVEIGYFDTGDQNQSFQTISEFAASSPTQIFTQTTTGGAAVLGALQPPIITTTITSNSPPPDHIISQKLTQDNYTRMQSAAAVMIVRRELGRRGSGTTLRFGLGPRFLQFEDRFRIGYESNQYAYNRGPTGVTGGGVGGAGGIGGGGGVVPPIGGGGIGGGGIGGGGIGGGGIGGGGIGGGGGQQIGNNAVVIGQSSAGDVLGIAGNDTLTGRGASSPLQTGQWQTATYNNMVGPEISLLLESTRGRWTFLSELKFTAGLNWQNMLYNGSNFPNSIGADYLRATFNPSVTNVSDGTAAGQVLALQPPPLFLQIYGIGQQNATNAARHTFVFTPIGEWRLGGEFRVSQAITLRAGYTGVALGNIARASSNTGYRSVPQSTQYAEVLDPTQAASITNPWVVKTTGAPPPGSVAVPGDPNTFKDPLGNYYTNVASPYHRDDPVYNRIAPTVGNAVQDYVFTNGVDFGIEFRY
ncbi:MAG: hypothetical protein ACKOSQ_02475 [Planctomycetaceae bacterium]